MRYKKKKGSTLLVVVCLCTFLSVLTLSIMVVTTGGFKLRKEENTRIEKFYSADSGIEIAKNETTKVIEDAIQKGNDRVKAIEEKNTDSDTKYYDDNSIQYYYEDYEKGKLKPNYQQEGFKRVFERYIEKHLEERIEDKDGKFNVYTDFKRSNSFIKVDARLKERPKGGEYKPGNKRYQIWGIESSFREDKNDNERIVQVDYKIKTPDYGREVKEKKGGDTNIFDYIIGIDGNLDVYSGASFKSLGDMWIGGKNQGENKRRNLLTYDPAIKLQKNGESGSFDWNGDIVTGKDLMIEDSSVKVNNIYANDMIVKVDNIKHPSWEAGESNDEIIIGGLRTGEQDKTREIGNLNLYGDLVFDAKGTILKAKNYFGLDEKNTFENPTSEDLKRSSDDWKKSSSIIVVSEDFGKGSKIDIENDLYVMGTAYLQSNKGLNYQTGESIAINKHSEPYTKRRIEDEGKYLYKYYNPLQIVDKKIINGEKVDLEVRDKVEIVKKYIESIKNDPNVDKSIFSGIDIGKNSYTTGIMYDSGSIAVNHIGDLNSEFIKKKRKEFKQETYNMGGEFPEYISEKTIEEMNSPVVYVKDSFNWESIRRMIDRNIIPIKGEGNGNLIKVYQSSKDDKITNTAIFKSEKTVEEMLPVFKNDDSMKNKYLRIIFNISNPSEKKRKLIFKSFPESPNQKDLIKENNNGDIEISIDTINNSNDIFNIVISDGDIDILGDKAINLISMFYTTENLNIKLNDVMTFGNFMTPSYNQLNKVFKEFFKLVDGVVIGNESDKGESEYVINVSDLLEQENWKLIK